MREKRLLIVLLPFLYLLIAPFVVQAATITTCNFDKEIYHQGETGHITVTVYNDKSDKIRITELTATIDYHYTDGNVYLQTFFTNASLPTEIQQGQTNTFNIPFSLPTNIASGYTNVDVRAETELWSAQAERWFWSDRPTYRPTLYIESPYKQQSEEYQQQLEEQLMINRNITTMIYLLGATTVVFAAVTAFLFTVNRRAKFIQQPMA